MAELAGGGRRVRGSRWWVVVLALTALVLPAVPGPAAAEVASSWPMAGRDAANSRSNPDEQLLGPANVGSLTRRWSATLGGTIAATPAVVDGTVYVPEAGGTLRALDAATGATRWSRAVSTYTGITGDSTRSTPAVVGGNLYFGNRVSSTKGAQVVSVSAADGALRWATVVDPSSLAKITAAPTVVGGVVYLGISSNDERSGNCCGWRGSVVALDAVTGAVRWRTMTVPTGYTGGAVWSSAPAVDTAEGLVYITTGNNYSAPPGVCIQPAQTGCTAADPRNHADAILALRTSDGSVAWSLKTLSADISSTVCLDPAHCGPDFDFGAGANLFTATIGGVTRKLVGAGQKSGIYWAADARTGAQVWSTRVGPGGSIGGIQWGTATDGRRIYVAETDAERRHYALTPSGDPVSGGSVAALDPATGKILWQTADPQSARDFGFVSTANGVVYAGSDAVSGPNMFALDASTGKLLWTYDSGGSVMGGAAVVDGQVYWASGYYTKTCPTGQTTCTTPNVLHAFALPTGDQLPGVPTAVTTSHDDVARSATISWSPPASDGGTAVTGYRVLRDGLDTGGNRSFAAVVPATTRTFTFRYLNAWDTYHLQVQAVNAVGTGAPGTGTTTVGAPTPSMPTGVLANRGNGSATLTWTAPTRAGSSAVTGYRVRRYAGATSTLQATTTLAATARSFTATGLTNGASYSFDVAAVNGSGTGRTSDRTDVVTPAAAPTVPTGVTVSHDAAARSATISWAPPTSTGGVPVAGYRVSRDGTDSGGTGAFTTVVGASTRTFTFRYLNPWDTYQLRVQALNVVGTGPAGSGSVTVTAPTPSAPTAVTATRGNARVTLTWGAPVHTGTSAVTGYRVRRYAGGTSTLQSTTTVAGTARSFTATGLTNGTGYSFDVTAVNASGTGRVSARTPVVVPATVPGAPVIGPASSGTAGGTITATATWSPPASTGGSAITGYRVTAVRLSSTGAVLATTVSALQPASARSLVMTLPVTGSYRFSVQASNAVGTSAASARSGLVTAR